MATYSNRQRDAIVRLAAVYRWPDPKIPLGNHISCMFALLDLEPEPSTVTEIAWAAHVTRALAAQTLDRFVQQGALAIRMPDARWPDIPRYIATRTLSYVASGYNELFATMIAEHRQDTQRHFMDGAIRSMANGIHLDNAGPLPTVVGRIQEELHVHPQTVLYRAMGGTACFYDILPQAIQATHEHITNYSPPLE